MGLSSKPPFPEMLTSRLCSLCSSHSSRSNPGISLSSLNQAQPRTGDTANHSQNYTQRPFTSLWLTTHQPTASPKISSLHVQTYLLPSRQTSRLLDRQHNITHSKCASARNGPDPAATFPAPATSYFVKTASSLLTAPIPRATLKNALSQFTKSNRSSCNPIWTSRSFSISYLTFAIRWRRAGRVLAVGCGAGLVHRNEAGNCWSLCRRMEQAANWV